MADLLLSKFDVAERQLLQAIAMFFREEDPVSIHTLTASASQVLYEIREKYSATSAIRDSDFFEESIRGLISSQLSESSNFFRHVTLYPDTHHAFKSVFNHAALIDAISVYSSIKTKHVPETFTFMAWYSREYPKHIKRESVCVDMLEKISRALPDQQDMQAWYNFIRMLRRGRILHANICLEYGL